jgi:hypothetical protein
MGLLQTASNAVVQGFTNPQDTKQTKDGLTDLVVVLLAFFLALVLLSLVGKLLWNNIVVDLVSIARPARSVWQILGLFIFVALIRP